MWLKQIKIAGFKSFVEPMTLPLHQQRTAVVGPNGCGKSNVVDAIRWVIGENSSKHLRAGSSLDEVIFKGSDNRQPVGRAYVELLFDNSNSPLAGQYSQYSEISVSRAIHRDGDSTYYFNNTRCRRKDIMEAFMGTGLGSRSYAIIEQGTIAELVQASPQQLRSYLEEVAGIALYKERRKETEKRLTATQENLDRLNDLAQEIEENVQNLSKQAENARRYRQLSADKRFNEALLNACYWQELAQKTQQLKSSINNYDSDLQSKRDERGRLKEQMESLSQRIDSLNARIEHQRDEDERLNQRVLTLQKQIDQQLERRQNLDQQWQSLNEQWQQADNEQHIDEDKLAELRQRLEETNQQHDTAKTELEQARANADKAQKEYQSKLDEYNDKRSQWHKTQAEQKRQSERLEQIRDQRDKTASRINELDERLASFDLTDMREQATKLQKDLERKQSYVSECETDYQQKRDKLDELTKAQKALNESLQDQQHQYQKLDAERQSLETLQQQTLQDPDETVNRLLKSYQLQDNPRLGEILDVMPEWRFAVETVLAYFLQGICVDNINDYVGLIDELNRGRLTMLEPESGQTDTVQPGSLASCVNSANKSVTSLLANVYIAEDAQKAQQKREKLRTYESVITPQGFWAGPNWLFVNRGANEQSGTIERQDRLNELAEQLKDLKQSIEAYQQQDSEQQQAIDHKRRTVTDAETKLSEARDALSQAKAALNSQNERIQNSDHHRRLVEKDLESYREEIQAQDELCQNIQNKLDELAEQEQELANIGEKAQKNLADAQTAKQEADTAYETAKNSVNELEQNAQRLQDHIEHLEESRRRSQQKWQQLEAQKSKLQQAYDDLVDTTEWQQQVDHYQAERQQCQKQLETLREQLTEAKESYHQHNNSVDKLDEQIDQVRRDLEKNQLEAQTAETQKKQYESNMAQSDYNWQDLEPYLTERLDTKELQNKIAGQHKQIEKLGAVNLAAEEQYNAAIERQQYLRRQVDDLSEAVNNLQQAIKRIDHDTRQALRSVLDEVNQSFSELFPRVFEGGQAYLRQTEQDLLSSGVEIVACPPGKRTNQVQMLSGGEKALTAIALVFALFQQNPAPFCVLDEVDAPLDDANVGRFGALLRDMSSQVQFVLITHNKYTMEMCEHLVGVTMQEPGVSRLVSVNLSQALEYSEAVQH